MWRHTDRFIGLVPATVYLFLFGAPLMLLTYIAFFEGDPAPAITEMLSKSLYRDAFLNSLRQSVIVAIIATAIAYPLCMIMYFASPRMRTLLTIVLLVPFWTSVLVRSFAWVLLLGRNGVVNSFLIDAGLVEKPVGILYTEFAAVLGMVHVLLPFTVFPLLASMRTIPGNLLLAARSLGETEMGAWRRIFLPMSLPGVLNGFVLTFVIAMGFYITPALLGDAQSPNMAMLIEMLVNSFLDLKSAAILSVFVIVTVFFCLFLLRFLSRSAVSAGYRR